MDDTTTARNTPPNESAPTSGELPGCSVAAAVRNHDGSADMVELERVALPTPGRRHVLIEVEASAIDRGVVHLLTGLPQLLMVAASVVAVRADVGRFLVGESATAKTLVTIGSAS